MVSLWLDTTTFASQSIYYFVSTIVYDLRWYRNGWRCNVIILVFEFIPFPYGRISKFEIGIFVIYQIISLILQSLSSTHVPVL